MERMDDVDLPPLPAPEPPLADAVAALVDLGAAFSQCAAHMQGFQLRALAETGDPGRPIREVLTEVIGSILVPVAESAGQKSTALVAAWLKQAVKAMHDEIVLVPPESA
jgi:hypothetical protein